MTVGAVMGSGSQFVAAVFTAKYIFFVLFATVGAPVKLVIKSIAVSCSHVCGLVLL